ncbi:aldo/keto reductase [Actinosynnema mirum]|uniref:Aldo/keto reductase n=1 Tax=Actinosynnema mirum (strain ATCC 29888 / DSM 43827 / JCM 3225 / NBRC 14064 / NCIMB 13271 / NRRL B-12336 / IMRU 3971 / 101) TaxID=446462 RepID=C6W9P8_ACTMD|nr:aldo/keto reductase [Actinosynnema mirum]ACU37265.1 aldo/keto reductase [Actinosynnema mirum DSM 43827]
MRYRFLGGSGLRVSELSLGTGNFGTGWGHGAQASEARAMYDAYREAGGNFIDTASNYQAGDAEEHLADIIASDREDVVLATKYSAGTTPASGLHLTGNSRKAMVQSLEQSLRRLGTDRVDVFWAHVADGGTPVEEVLRAFDDLTRAGKVLYTGLCNFPAWRVAAGTVLARQRGWSPVTAIQVEYSLVERAADRELLPMAEALGLGVLGFSPLGGGLLTGKYRRGGTGRAESVLSQFLHREDDPATTGVLDAVESVAQDLGATPDQVAIRWSMARGVIPIIGPRDLAQFTSNLAAAELEIPAHHLDRLTEVSAPRLGYPHGLWVEHDRVERKRLAQV